MQVSDDQMRQMLAAVSAEFRAGLPARLAGVDALWAQVRCGGGALPALDELVRALHAIAGSAGIFGEAALGQAAAAAEAVLEAYREDRRLPDAAAQTEISRLLASLHRFTGTVADG
jgi:HPt (histidine-containing phosphotransfer) domain-containing protein